MIKTRIFQFVGHIHNMQLCIEMISFINHENESILRWFYRFCEPRNLAFVLETWSGCIQAGWGSDLWLSAVVLWNSASHVSTMLRSNLDLAIIRSLIFYTPPFVWRGVLAEDIVERWKNKGRRSRQNTANNKTTPPWQLLYWCRALGYSGYSILEIIVLILRSILRLDLCVSSKLS